VATIETDYLVIGAGASALAFTDALLRDPDIDVVLVDRRARPGGHWNDAYPFVRLHQPSASYGVNSRVLGHDTIDQTGPNAGFYERASGVEICDYFAQVLEHDLIGSGRVRFLSMCDYVGDDGGGHVVESRLTGSTTRVEARRRVVDTTYLECSVPATHRRSFSSDPDALVIPVGELTAVAEPPAGFTILGSGKTAMDACTWLLDNGVDPDLIRWVRPREPWLIDRSSVQPFDLLGTTIDRFATSVEVLAGADSIPDVFAELVSGGQLMQLDPGSEPTMYRGAIVSRSEVDGLRQIERVVRDGHVDHIGADHLVMRDGEVATTRGELHVDCTARGLGAASARPIFEDGRITLQSLMGGFTTYNAALVGFVEATRDDDREKNRLCPPTAPPTVPVDLIAFYRSVLHTSALHGAEPDLAAFQDEARLSLTHGLSARLGEPQVVAAVDRWLAHADQALVNADRLLGSAPARA
jgi:hypothetical protein